MDLDRSLLEMIDDYISDAMSSTGTRRAPRSTQQAQLVVAPEPEAADLEPQTEPFGAAYDEYESYEASDGAFVIDERNADAALLSQVSQQLAHSASALEPLPRTRAARGTAELEDEITDIVKRPDAGK